MRSEQGEGRLMVDLRQEQQCPEVEEAWCQY